MNKKYSDGELTGISRRINNHASIIKNAMLEMNYASLNRKNKNRFPCLGVLEVWITPGEIARKLQKSKKSLCLNATEQFLSHVKMLDVLYVDG